jgi:hypothetical protein
MLHLFVALAEKERAISRRTRDALAAANLFSAHALVSIGLLDLVLLRHEQNGQLAVHRGLCATDPLERLVTMLAPVAQKARNYLFTKPLTRAGSPSGNV